MKIEEHYTFDERKPIGKGSFGIVVLGIHKDTKGERAIKIIPKENIDD